MQDYSFKEVEISEARVIAKVHLNSFPNFFLSSLGYNFLYAFYRALIKNDAGIGIIVYKGTDVVGFAIGTIRPNGFYSSLLKNNFVSLTSAALIRLIKSPGKILRLITSLKGGASLPKEIRSSACLLSICIDPAYQASGLGSRLLTEFEILLKTRKHSSYFLTTDAEENYAVNHFYLRNNCKIYSTFLQGEKRRMNLYFKDNL